MLPLFEINRKVYPKIFPLLTKNIAEALWKSWFGPFSPFPKEGSAWYDECYKVAGYMLREWEQPVEKE